jgi:hypothetical protein
MTNVRHTYGLRMASAIFSQKKFSFLFFAKGCKETKRGCMYYRHLINQQNNTNNMIKPIPSLPTYYATADGRIFRYRKKTDDLYQLSDNTRSNSGYKLVQPFQNGKRKLKYVHQLVLEAFKGPRPDNMQCDHINHDRLDNSIDNLRYVTVKENLHRRRPYQTPSSYKQHKTPLYKKYLSEIIKLRKNGNKPAVIADKLSIPVKTVYYASRYIQH